VLKGKGLTKKKLKILLKGQGLAEKDMGFAKS